MRLMLIPGNATFRRSIRDENGSVLAVLVFEEGKVQDLDADQFAAVRKDIGPALCIARDDRDQPDWKATEEFQIKAETGLQHVMRKMTGAKRQRPVATATSDQ